MTCLLFWGVLLLRDHTLHIALKPTPAEDSARPAPVQRYQAAVPERSPAVRPSSSSESRPQQRGASSAPDAKKAAGSSARPDPGGRSPASGSGTGAPAASGPERTDKTPDPPERDAITSALSDLQDLAFEEPPATLPEAIRHVDYALVQALSGARLPLSAMRIYRVEARRAPAGNYVFQEVDVLAPDPPAVYVRHLEEGLRTWADGAVLTREGRDGVRISISGVPTHHIRLYPGARAFPAAREPAASVAGPGPVRTAGEPARLVIVMDDLGESMQAMRQVLDLDFPVTCAFWPHASHVREAAVAAHARGLEILVHQPMEPIGYPTVKPGPNVLLVSMSPERMRAVLEENLRKVPHASGLNNHMGSRFTQDSRGTGVVLDVLRRRNMFMLDSVTHPQSVFYRRAREKGVPAYRRDVFLDVTATRTNVLAELQRAERIALLTGQAVAIGHPLPATLAGLKEWEKKRDRRVRIVRLRDLRQR